MTVLKYDGSAAAQTAAPVANLYGTNAVDSLIGTFRAESLWGGQGDLMTGGLGDDTYYIKHAGDRVVELAGQGVDTIAAWSNVYLGDHPAVENVIVGGSGTYGAGNALDNIIEGQGGSQQLYGGFGQDVLIGGAGADVFIVVKGQGNDAIADFAIAEDKVRLSAGFSDFTQVKAAMTQVGADVKLNLGGADGLVFRNVTVGQFTAANFQLELNRATLGAQTFGDEFSGALSLWDAQSNPTGTWRPDFGYQGEQGTGSYTLISNNEKQIYTSPYFRGHNGDFAESPFVSNADGTLSIWARPSDNGKIFGYDYTSGFISTKESHAQTYGYFEMRADLPASAGAWPAFWLIPADGSWPPELDVMEVLTSDPRATWTTEHSGVGGHSSNGKLAFTPDTASGFHTYGALWTATDIVWYIDSVEVFRSATPADMHKPMFMIANLALGGWGGAINEGQLPAELKIDYIRAYALGDGSAPLPAPIPTPAPAPTPTPTPTPPPPPAGGTGVVLNWTAHGDTLTGGAGGDTINASQGADRLTGGAGADTFAFKAMPWSAGKVLDFQVGVDKLDISKLYVGGYTGSDPLAAGYVRFESDGAGGTKVMLDVDAGGAANPWAFHVVTLAGVSPIGLTAAQVFGGAPVAPPPPAAPQAPTTAPGVVLTWATHGDTLNGGAGADTINASQGADRLTGGAGGDTFAFKAMPWSAGKVLDFQKGVDKLDLSKLYIDGFSGADPIAAGYVRFEGDGQGGTKVMLDLDAGGTAHPWAFHVTTLVGVSNVGLTSSDVFKGGSAPVAAPAPAPAPVIPGVVLTSDTYADILAGGAGNDTLNAGQGPDQLTGGAGDNRFVFGDLPWNAGHVKDFNVAGGDVLDLRELFRDAGYTGANPLADGYLRFDADGNGNTRVMFDADGHGAANPWATTITTLDGIAASSLTASDWLFH